MQILGKGIGYLLTWIYSVIGNYGISVIILTVIVRLLMLPLYKKQFEYSQSMARIQPKVNEINTRYAADRKTRDEKINELYATENITATAGCLPTLIQMPIILGLFALLREPVRYMTSSVMAVAVHESFIWIQDLSQPDMIILPILAAVSTYFSSASNESADAGNGMMKGMKYFFPLMIFIMGRSFPAALALYWAVGNFATLVQQKAFASINKKKILIEEVKNDMRAERKRNRNPKKK